jgi:ribosomal protein S9
MNISLLYKLNNKYFCKNYKEFIKKKYNQNFILKQNENLFFLRCAKFSNIEPKVEFMKELEWENDLFRRDPKKKKGDTHEKIHWNKKPIEKTSLIPNNVIKERKKMDILEPLPYYDFDGLYTLRYPTEEELQKAYRRKFVEEKLVLPLPREKKIDKFGRAFGYGGRKTSQAQVWIKEGTGNFFINGRKMIEYIPEYLRPIVIAPLLITDLLGNFDINVIVKGGGISGQAGAIRHGISRALQAYDPDLR